KWVTHDEAYASPHFASNAGRNVPSGKKGSITSQSKSVDTKPNKHDLALPGQVLRVNPMRQAKAAASSLAVGKRKRPNEKPKVVSEEEKQALKAREAARKRVEQREKPMLGLYSKPY
ncbi:WW domain-binding protein, partial [Trifolium medium]|nr:WW domain-binding protein [Trifolium medium]